MKTDFSFVGRQPPRDVKINEPNQSEFPFVVTFSPSFRAGKTAEETIVSGGGGGGVFRPLFFRTTFCPEMKRGDKGVRKLEERGVNFAKNRDGMIMILVS